MSEESLLPVRREREMTRTHSVLWSAILVATVLDVLTTMVGLERGLREGNAVVAAAIDALGLPGLWLVKFAAMVWLVGGWALLSDRDAAIFLALFAVVTVATVVANTATLLGVALQ
ncbi:MULTISPECIES: DUF5658 family protein [Halomicrobium]|uniref:DUF5658 domain-containing protein n=2 Tax=Halomicrobium mukohataei TaxID=57705 RepID=C7NVX2_HALMD|nr:MULTISPECIES: DUF5658 family protein [Halomicrobium]ACV48101.1 conserved hypothetical protein [Halomicrobium mukohataei DSM 12286]QCD66531.1 hypothetical protein E5139_13055 [Halomicrobium mukohataei]QFR21337.1 hypothetical protein GBQ70_13070 [Halomicrobium sp. ZPS1]